MDALFTILFSQHPASPAGGLDVAAWLQAYGPWAIVVALSSAIVALARAYVKSRDSKDAVVTDVHAKVIDLVTRTTEAIAAQKDSNEKVAEALKTFASRLEQNTEVTKAGVSRVETAVRECDRSSGGRRP